MGGGNLVCHVFKYFSGLWAMPNTQERRREGKEEGRRKGRNREEGREGRQGGEGGRKRGNEKTEEEILFLLFFLESDHYNDKPSNVYSLYLLQNFFALLASFQ